jgi:Mor family transcriptional regulator
MPKIKEEIRLADDLILLCSHSVSEEEAQKGVRALCREFGGLMVYVPAKADGGASAEKIRGALADVVGDRAALLMLEKIMTVYGGMQVYIPFERSAFKKVIALEIYARCGKDGLSINDLAKEYRISFSHCYRLYYAGQRERREQSLPYLPFLEFAQNENAP